MSTNIEFLRHQNRADLEIIRAGQTCPADRTEAVESLGAPVLLAEYLITRGMRHRMTNNASAMADTAQRLESLLLPEVEAALHPMMRWAWALLRAAIAFGHGDYEQSLNFASRSEVLAEETKYADAMASSLSMLGLLAYRVEAFERAIELFIRSVEEKGTPRSKAIAHTHLATVFESQGDLELALSHRELTLQLLEGEEITDLYRFECDYCSTLIMLERFTQARERIPLIDRSLPDARAFVCLLETERALAEGDFDEALRFGLTAERLFDELQMVSYRRAAVDLQGEALVKLGHYGRALEVLTKDLAPPDTIGHLKACELLVKAHRQLGQWEEAVHYEDLLRSHMEQRQFDLHSFHQLREKSHHLEALEAKNRALDKRNQEFEVLRSDRENLLRIVAHELRSPLTALGLVLASIEERAGHRIDFEERVATGSRMVRRLQGIADQVATVGELTSGTFEVELSEVDLDQAISRVLDEQRLVAGRKSVVIEGPSSGLGVLGHQGRLEQVLTNLVSNAIKFSAPGTSVCVGASSVGGLVEITVKDQGPGLTPLDLDRVFRRYARLSARPTGGETSSGMGLFIAKQLSLAMGGDIFARSDGDGPGSTFTVQLSRASRQEPR